MSHASEFRTQRGTQHHYCVRNSWTIYGCFQLTSYIYAPLPSAAQNALEQDFWMSILLDVGIGLEINVLTSKFILQGDQLLGEIKDYKVQDMTVNTKSHKRLTCSVCCLLAATERESITVHFGINLKQLHILKLIIIATF